MDKREDKSEQEGIQEESLNGSPKRLPEASPQKFKRGDLVHIAADLGSWMRHFTADVDAIVIGSYADQYGGSDTDRYTVLFIATGDQCSWYHEHQLTLIRHVGEASIEEAKAARVKREAVETDLDWIIENWKNIRKKPPGATMAELMRRIGITNPRGSHGEGYVYHANMMATYKVLDPILVEGDRAAILSLLRPEGPGEPCEPEHSSPSTPHPQREG